MTMPILFKKVKMILVGLVTSISMLIIVAQSYADTTRRSPSDDGAFTAGPYYNSTTRSYFELIRRDSLTWENAEIEATNHTYKNTVGRLAVVDRPETHMFLVRNFIFTQDTWIGLRFVCKNSDLIWPDGISHKGKPFSNWSSTSNQNNLSCPETGHLYTFINGNAFDWTLADWEKSSRYMLVEYQTGRR